jgi:hypothetical protein
MPSSFDIYVAAVVKKTLDDQPNQQDGMVIGT